MDRETLERLRLDRRLIRQRGWIAEEELERELAKLPDVADKAVPLEETPSRAADAEPPAGPAEETPDA